MGIGLGVVNFLDPPWEGSFSEQSVSGWALALRDPRASLSLLGCRMLRELSVPMITSGYSEGDELYWGHSQVLPLQQSTVEHTYTHPKRHIRN